MPKPIIEEMRKSLMSSKVYSDTIRKANTKKFFEEKEEEIKMAINPFLPPTPGVEPMGAPVMQQPQQVPVMQGASVPMASTNINKMKEDTIAAAIKKSLTFRPLGIVTDGMEMYTYVFDKDNPELAAFVENWKRENRKEDKVTGQSVAKSITAIRAVKELCMASGQDPKTFAEYGDDGQPKLKLKKPAIKGFLVKFPKTETSGEYVDIIKKANLADAITRAGGFSLAGTFEASNIDKEKHELPISLVLSPTSRKVKDRTGRSEQRAILRISGKIVKDLQKSLFPEKNNVGLYDMFNKISDVYPLTRVVPLKLYKTELVNGKQVGILDLSPEKKLAQYESYENPLTDEMFGKGIMEAVGKTAAELQGTFARKSAATGSETESDLIKSVMEAYLGSDSDPAIADRYINSLLQR